jgi:hypothetical protein
VQQKRNEPGTNRERIVTAMRFLHGCYAPQNDLEKATISPQFCGYNAQVRDTHIGHRHMTFDEACKAILQDPKANTYAKGYANAGLRLKAEFIPTQALYILTNLDHWRGDKAKEVKACLKAIVKEDGL